ncbi:hypothetical protein [Streptomyces sp. NPDC020681]|uniref:hypothetical protein n=1 Tax=Streptomyces sp. NPDC020681 TaxID=3365083 RepID=UPI0037A0BF41
MSTTDFDFLVGEWAVANRRLKDFLDESSGWEEFTAVSRASRHFDGGANFDEIEFPTMGFRGLTLRLYDTEREEWSLYWSNDRRGVLDPPVVGRFGADGRGVFHGDDTYQGKDVRVRFLWSGITETTARWEQAFSVDGEKTWLTNWVMESTRRG